MVSIRNIHMRPKLVALFLLIGISALVVTGFWASRQAEQALLEKSYDQLESVREIKRQAVERYFTHIQNQILTFSENSMVVEAMRELQEVFPNFREENQYDAADIRRMANELVTYYTNDFSAEFRNQNNDRDPRAKRYFDQLDDDSIAYQYHYIKANPNPLGSKEVLDRAPDQSAYSALHAELHPVVRSYLQKFGYYDIFLVDPDSGDIVYSVFKELDYSTSLIDGPYADTNFGEVFRMANAATQPDIFYLVDYAQYFPSYEAPASFIASPIFDGAKKIGVAIFQMPIDALNAIMTERAGLGRSGESYLVGPDLLMRSDSYLDPENHSVTASFRRPETGGVDTVAVREALASQTGSQIVIDYNGNPVLSAYAPVAVGDTTWALMAEIDEAEVMEPVFDLIWSLVLVGILLSLILVVLAYAVAGSIAKPLRSTVSFAESIADGDLTIRADPVLLAQKDEVGELVQAMDRMVGKLREIIGSVVSGTNNITAASEQNSATAQSLSQGASQQASSVEETTASVEQMSASIEQNTENAKVTDTMASKAATDAGEGGEAVSKTVDAMKSIADKISIIDDIAYQTNLLALNAAIEAARAGEHGKGFAVVASEVRKLAERSQVASQEIGEVAKGSVNLAVRAGELLDEIVPAIRKTSDLVQEISAASSEQSAGANQINMAMEQLNSITQQSASSSEELASTSEEMSSQAQQLQQLVSFFKIGDHSDRRVKT